MSQIASALQFALAQRVVNPRLQRRDRRPEVPELAEQVAQAELEQSRIVLDRQATRTGRWFGAP